MAFRDENIRTILLRDDDPIVGVPLGPGPLIAARLKRDGHDACDRDLGKVELDTLLIRLDSDETVAMILSNSMIQKFGGLIESVVIANSSESERVAFERKMGARDPDQAARDEPGAVKLKFHRKPVFDRSGKRLVQYHCSIVRSD